MNTLNNFNYHQIPTVHVSVFLDVATSHEITEIFFMHFAFSFSDQSMAKVGLISSMNSVKL